MQDEEENQSNNAGAGGIVGLIILYLILAFFFKWWPFTNYEIPWWDGTESQRVCVVHNPTNDNCYTLAVTVEDKKIVEMEFPNGGYATIVSMECGKAVTFEGRYCDVTDSKSGDWQVEKHNQ